MKVTNKVLLTYGLVLLGMFFVTADTIYATGQGGGSQGGTTTQVTCSTAEHTRNIEQCSDNYGGASWHVFKLANGVKFGAPELGDGVPIGKRSPIYAKSLDVITGKGENDVKKLGQNCPAADYDYFVAYVYDGWNGSNLSGGPHYYGPAQWGDVDDCPSGSDMKHCPVYHTRGTSYSAKDVLDAIKQGKDVNTWRISGTRPKDGKSSGKYDTHFESAEAQKLYNKYRDLTGKEHTTLKNIGYFCMPTTYKSFTGRIRASGGVDTGYVNTDKTENKSVDSGNSGYRANFRVYLKRDDGNESTSFWTNTTNLKVSPFKPSTTGTEVGNTLSKVIKPGESACRYIKFKPYGNLKVDDTATLKACISAKVTEFQSKSSVSGATSGEMVPMDMVQPDGCSLHPTPWGPAPPLPQTAAQPLLPGIPGGPISPRRPTPGAPGSPLAPRSPGEKNTRF